MRTKDAHHMLSGLGDLMDFHCLHLDLMNFLLLLSPTKKKYKCWKTHLGIGYARWNSRYKNPTDVQLKTDCDAKVVFVLLANIAVKTQRPTNNLWAKCMSSRKPDLFTPAVCSH